jgi:hypothetical protein
VKWFAIFKTGKHTDSSGKTREWTEQDLDKIVETYNPQEHEAPIVIGHPKTNAPAFGWIEKLKRVGDTLYALPKQLNKDFVEMVRNGLFKERSISLYPDGRLRHVGFLGAAPPAVKGLPDVEFSDEELQTIEISEFNDIDEDEKNNSNSNNVIKELEEKLKVYEEKLKQMEKKEQEFTELQNKISELEKELKAQKHQLELKNFEEYVDKQISEGKILPKMKEKVLKLMDVISTYEFSESQGTQPIDLVKEIIESMPKVIEFGEKKEPEQGENKSNKSVTEVLAEEIRKSQLIK